MSGSRESAENSRTKNIVFGVYPLLRIPLLGVCEEYPQDSQWTQGALQGVGFVRIHDSYSALGVDFKIVVHQIQDPHMMHTMSVLGYRVGSTLL